MAVTPAKATPLIDTEPTNTPDEFSYKHATFDEVLEDLSSRFILNLPEDELAEVERVCFQVEQAHWYYEDFIRDENPSFASLPLKKFSEILFRSCPLLQHWSHDHETAFNGFMSYKTRVPVCGAIMLNEALTKCVLVKGWKSSAGWGFPKGKVNENENEAFCAAREVLEETGYNLSGQIRRTDCIRLCVKQQPITLFVVAGVPEDFAFKTQTRKEISKIEWFKLADLPTWKKNRPTSNKFYLITPAIGPLKAIVRNLRKARKAAKLPPHAHQITETVSTPEEDDELEPEDSGMAIAIEPLGTVEREASQSQSGEAEISSSQSSSIDPHTPSVNGDLGPHTSSNRLSFKHSYPDVEDSAADAGIDGPIEVTPPGFNGDSRTHWSRLMTRLNHSQESSPQTTPQASTPTPPISSSQPRPESRPPDGSIPQHGPTVGAVVEVLKDYASRRSPTVTRSSSFGSEHLSDAASFPPRGSLPPQSAPRSQTSPSLEQLVKRTRQLQLLESVVSEESSLRSAHLAPPMSAHTLGEYPRPSSVFIPDQARAPLRSASVNPDIPRSQFVPYHHQHMHSTSSLSGVLSSQVPASPLHHQVFRPSYSNPFQHQSIIPPPGRGNAQGHRPPQLHLHSQPYAVAKPLGSPIAPLAHRQNPSVESAHKGQMLSILSGGTRPPPTFGEQGSLSSHRSCPSVSTMVPRGPSHLLSILNNPSPTRAGRGAGHSRQLEGG